MIDQNKILPKGLEIPDNTHQVRWVKSLGLALLAAVSFGLTWQMVASGFAQGHGLLFWFWPMLAAAFGITFLSLLAVVNNNKYLFWGVNFGVLVWYLFALPKDWFIAAGGVIFLLLSFLFEQRIRQDEKFRVDFSLSRILRYNLSIMVYALLFIIGFSIYYQTQQQFRDNPEAFYNEIGYHAARGLEYVPTGLGNFDPDQRFDDFVVSQAEREYPEYSEIPPAQQEAVTEEVKQQLLERFNIQVSGNPLLGEVVAGAVADKVEQASSSYQKFFPAIFAVIAAALLRTIAFVFVWLTMMIAWLVYRILLLVKFFRIEKVQIEVNKLQI